MERRVMTPRTLHLRPQKSSRQNIRLGRHRHIVLRGHLESLGSTAQLRTFHRDQLSHKTIHRQIILQRFVNPKPERACVVQRRIHDRRIFSQHILPIGYPVIGPPRVVQ